MVAVAQCSADCYGKHFSCYQFPSVLYDSSLFLSAQVKIDNKIAFELRASPSSKTEPLKSSVSCFTVSKSPCR